jgi:hypothetical protein
MALTPVSCFEITIKRSGPPIERINGGDTEQEAKNARYRNSAPALALLEEVFSKIVDAIRQRKPQVMLNIKADGTIVSDPSWTPPTASHPAGAPSPQKTVAMTVSLTTEEQSCRSASGRAATKKRSKKGAKKRPKSGRGNGAEKIA